MKRQRRIACGRVPHQEAVGIRADDIRGFRTADGRIEPGAPRGVTAMTMLAKDSCTDFGKLCVVAERIANQIFRLIRVPGNGSIIGEPFRDLFDLRHR